MTQEEKEKLIKMRKHLGLLHKKWQEEPDYDGHSKSNEGSILLLYRWDNWFECESDAYKYIKSKPKLYMIEVYSYLFGPHRLHTFYTVDEAYNEVMTWK